MNRFLRQTFFAVALLTTPAAGQDVIEMVSSLPVFSYARFGPDCVVYREFQLKVCAPAAREIIGASGSFYGTNLIHRGPTVTVENQCATLSISVVPADHRGQYPAYLCSPGTGQAQLTVALGSAAGGE